MKLLKGKSDRPRRILTYGVHGVGKSTWAAQAPSPLFLDIEDGIGDLDVERTEHLKDFGQVISAISYLISNQTEHKTIVLDSLDWLERLIFRQVATDEDKKTIDEIAYGRGYRMAAKKWDYLLRGLNELRSNGKTIVLLAHSVAKRFSPPDSDSYERYEPALHEVGSRIIQEWCDEVLFAQFRVMTRKADEGFGNKRTMAIDGKERFIRTSESASVVAKNRLGLPSELPMEWGAYAAHLGNGKGNISGLVKDGSSKKKEKVNG